VASNKSRSNAKAVILPTKAYVIAPFSGAIPIARALAALNHPNIATIHGIAQTAEPASTGRASAVRAIVLELVEGPTLSERLARGPVPLDEALAIARQIAEALDAAHEKGIVHRDLKPAKSRSDLTAGSKSSISVSPSWCAKRGTLFTGWWLGGLRRSLRIRAIGSVHRHLPEAAPRDPDFKQWWIRRTLEPSGWRSVLPVPGGQADGRESRDGGQFRGPIDTA
jgi:hypothetical protein